MNARTSHKLCFRAGPGAYGQIRDQGLRPDDVALVAGAAGGPKWLVLSQLDRVLFGQWLAGRQEPLALVGSSIGTWRFAAASRRSPLKAIGELEQAYLAQHYGPKPTAQEVSNVCREILAHVLADGGAAEVLGHQCHRLTAILTGCRGPAAVDHKVVQGAGLLLAATCNLMSPRGLGVLLDRCLYRDGRSPAPLKASASYRFRDVVMAPEQLAEVLLASGSIPLVMAGVRGLGQAKEVFRDGGLIDYHLAVPFLLPERKLVLFPHFSDRFIPGWFDKALTWRRPSEQCFDRVLQIYPSREFLATLPNGRILIATTFTLTLGVTASGYALGGR